MNQDSFRQLLTTPRPGSCSTLTRPGIVGKSNKNAVLDPSQPAFQPRKVTKKVKQSEYRDRASERRAGVNEYTRVESVLEDFQQQTSHLEDRAAVEEQRRYLGGDKDHTILVKGLDLALLEQNKARATASYVDDDSLEAAFQDAQIQLTIPKKRTREDLVRKLKEKRVADGAGPSQLSSEADDALEEAKKIGKFKPIGAPDNLNDKEVLKKAKGKSKEEVPDGDRKKKRRRVVPGSTNMNGKHSGDLDRSQPSMVPPRDPSAPTVSTVYDTSTQPSSSSNSNAMPHALEEDGNDVDIFADVGEYEGMDFGEEDDDQQGVIVSPSFERLPTSGSSQHDENIQTKNWFKEKELTPLPGPSVVRSPTPLPASEPHEEAESGPSTRLAPLTSSALPSISDFLAMDSQAGVRKRRAKKDKKDKKGKVSTKKVDRDYKQLNSYLAKKGGGEGT